MKAYRYIVFLFMLSFSTGVHAQFGFDVGSIEASIADHKRMRSVLLAYSLLEQVNVVLHEQSSDAATDQKEIFEKLEAYYTAFDILDLILKGTATAFTVVNTIEDVRSYSKKYKELLDRYNDMCLSRGNIVSSDSIIIGISTRLVERVSSDINQLITSYTDVVAYAGGLVRCKTTDLLKILTSIEENLNNIRYAIKVAYLTLWKYITLRTGYWKKQIYMAKTIKEMADDAFSHWRRVAKEIDY